MHPLTLYDAAVQEHRLATARRAHEDALRLRLRDRSGDTARPVHRLRRAPRTRQHTGRPAVA